MYLDVCTNRPPLNPVTATSVRAILVHNGKDFDKNLLQSTEKQPPPHKIKTQYSFHLNGHTLGSHPQTRVRTIINSTTAI